MRAPLIPLAQVPLEWYRRARAWNCIGAVPCLEWRMADKGLRLGPLSGVVVEAADNQVSVQKLQWLPFLEN